LNKKVAIIQSNYIPWKGYFDIINLADVFVIYDEVQYTKNDWRNRNLLKTKKGLEWITIPVKQHTLTQTIEETKVASSNWNIKHWKTLTAIYGKAPFFKEYKECFENLYLNIDTEFLSEINAYFIIEICKILKIDTKVLNSRDLNLEGGKSERLVDACLKLDANTYISGPSAKNYLDINLFNEKKINVEWVDYSNYKEYKQSGEKFEHGVSILDLLFNEGEEAKKYLKSFN